MSRENSGLSAASRRAASTVGRTVLIAGFILGALLLGSGFLIGEMPFEGKWESRLRLAAMLFLFWLVVSAGIRAADKLLKAVDVGWLFLTGLGVGVVGHLAQSLGFWAVARYTGDMGSWMPRVGGGMLSPVLAVSLLVTVLTVISVRVKSELMANALRALLFVLVAFLIYFFM